jgi:hypothetical protein
VLSLEGGLIKIDLREPRRDLAASLRELSNCAGAKRLVVSVITITRSPIPSPEYALTALSGSRSVVKQTTDRIVYSGREKTKKRDGA